MGFARTLLIAAVGLNILFAAHFSVFSDNYHVSAQETARTSDDLDELFSKLQSENPGDWQLLEDRIWEIWSDSGSASHDLLLERGREAMARGDFQAAISHFTTLIDHAPEFAEGWNARATVYFVVGEYGLSVFDIHQTLRLNPRHFGALAGLGLILEETGDLKAALDVYSEAEAIHPHRPDVVEAVKRLTPMVNGSAL